jgi:hypothetical protein
VPDSKRNAEMPARVTILQTELSACGGKFYEQDNGSFLRLNYVSGKLSCTVQYYVQHITIKESTIILLYLLSKTNFDHGIPGEEKNCE